MIKKTIALTGGSTGWHVFPLVSLYNHLSDSNKYKFLWFWEEGSLEEKTAKELNIEFYCISAWKLRRYFDFRNFYEPLKNLTWIIQALFYIKRYKIDIVFSKWWYVSLPISIWAKLMRKKLLIHESDSVSGISNSIVSKIADKVFYSFDNKNIDGSKHILSWQILNPDLLDSIDSLDLEENQKQKVLFIWWSQWSKNILEGLLKIIPRLDFLDFEIILWSKNSHLKQEFSNFENVKTYEFLHPRELWLILKLADIVITRAGSSLWEQNIFGLHSIIIPLKNSAWNHQRENAKYFKDNFWSDIIRDDENLHIKLEKKLIDYKDLRKIWLNLEKFYEPLNIIENEIKD